MLHNYYSLQAGDDLRVAVHGGHALAGVVVVHAQDFVRARRRQVDAAVVQRYLKSNTKFVISSIKYQMAYIFRRE